MGENAFRTHLDPTRSTFASEDVILFTETDYTMLVKPFNDDLACHVQHQVVPGCFAAAGLLSTRHIPPRLASYVGDGCALSESMSRTLNLAPSSTLGMYQSSARRSGIPTWCLGGSIPQNPSA
ncbi:hypothetical protein [Xanthomonas oryzae]|uniref:hypothetical protein n=1 Tax=Xanthomonas oryzae TaxID=347 RepID=UPI0012B0C9B5